MSAYSESRDVAATDEALMAAIATCGNKCKPQILASAWMYIGLVRGGGGGEWDTAREAFALALGFDPNIQLDPRFFTPTAQALFDGLKNKQTAAPDRPVEVKPQFESGSQLSCFPLVTEVETRRPVPLYCSTPMQTAEGVVVFYRRYGEESWSQVDLETTDGGWRGQLPCSLSMAEGTVGFYAESHDARGNLLERLGSRDKPVVFAVVQQTDQPPPSLPGEQPPERCDAGSNFCPEEMIGTPACAAFQEKAAGGATQCKRDTDCDMGLTCDDGQCKLVNQCTRDDQCEDGVCRAGRCEFLPTKPKLDRFGLHFGADISLLGAAQDVCGVDSPAGYACFAGEETYEGTPFTDNGGEVTAGAHFGTARILVTYDRFVASRFSLGARIGTAFSGAPEDFFPLHFEARGVYYFADVTQPRWRFAPYVGASIGLAQIDSRVAVQMVDCLPDRVERCLERNRVTEAMLDPETGDARVRELEAYKRLGRVFGAISPGAMLALTKQLSVVGNVSLLFTTEQEGASSLVLAVQPTLGVSVGF